MSTNNTYNSNHVATLGMMESIVLMAVESMKSWTLNNVDKTELMQNVKNVLDQCNRVSVGTTAAEKAAALLTTINSIQSALESSGVVIPSGTPLSQYATFIKQIAASGYEVCILGKSGKHYTPAEWNEHKIYYGAEPEADKVIAVISPYQSFVIGPKLNAQTPPTFDIFQWGNTSDTVSGLYAQQTGSFVNVLQNGLNFHSLENTYRMLLWYDPEVLPHTDYDPNDTTKLYDSYGCVRFSSKAELMASGIIMDSTQQVYIVTTDESDNNTSDNCYYWNGSAYAKRFQVPRVANGITGSPLAKAAWEYKAWAGDRRQYTVPTTNHLIMMFVYQTAINECLDAVYHSTLPSGNAWTCEQYGGNGAYFVNVSSGNVSTSYKSYALALVPVAALEEPQA